MFLDVYVINFQADIFKGIMKKENELVKWSDRWGVMVSKSFLRVKWTLKIACVL